MPIETENGNARRASRSAARRARGTARHGFARGFGKEKNGPERQAVPASSGARWQGKRGEVRARGERLADLTGVRAPRSFSGLRHPEEFGQEQMTRNTGHPLNLDRATRVNVPPLPTEYGRLINGWREQSSELLKAHPIVSFAVLGNCRVALHVDLGCIYCNIAQVDALHFSGTKLKAALDKVAP